MENIATLIPVILGIIALLAICLSAFLSYRRGFVLSLLKLGKVIISAIIAAIITSFLASTVSNLISGVLEADSLNELKEASPTLAELLSELPSALVSPIIFLSAFVAFSMIMAIVFAVIKRIPIFRVNLFDIKLWKFNVGRLCGMFVGIVTTVLTIVLITMPFAGYSRLVSDVADKFGSQQTEVEKADVGTDANDNTDNIYDETGTSSGSTSSNLIDINEKYIKPFADSALFRASYAIGGKAIFSSLTSVKLGSDNIKVDNEISFILDSYDTLKPVIDINFDFSAFTEKEADAIRQFAEGIDKSVLIPAIAGEIVPYAADKWLTGGSFVGAGNPVDSVPETMQPLMTNILNLLSSTNKETIKPDLVTIADIFATFAESGIFAMFGSDFSADEFLAALSEEGVLSSVISALYENERTQFLISDLSNIGFEAISEALEIPESDEDVYNNLMDELSEEIKTALSFETEEEQIDRLSFGITNIFEKYGVEISDEQANLYAQCIIGADTDVSEGGSESVSSYFSLLLSALQASSSSQREADRFYANGLSDKAAAVIEQFKAEMNGEDLSAMVSLTEMMSGKSSLKHNTVTTEDILVTLQDIKDTSSEAITAQGEAMELMLYSLSKIAGGDGDMSKLDAESLTEAILKLGIDDKGIGKSIKSILKFALSEAGIGSYAAQNLIEHISASAENNSANADVNAVISVITVISSDSSSKEQVKDAVKTLSSSVTPSSAEVISDCVSAGFIDRTSSGKLSHTQSVAVSSVVKNMLNNFAENSEELSGKQLEAETACVQMVIELSVSTQSSTASALFQTSSSQDSKLGMSADEFVDKLSDSVVLSDTIIDEQENIKTAVGNKMSQSDKDLLTSALEENSSISSQMKEALVNAFSLVG